MDKRKDIILNTIIKEHIKTGAPVGSSCLVDKYKLNISPATARNEMAALESEGFIIQPHTSAGRVPTEKAYRLYLANVGDKKLNKNETNDLDEILKSKNEVSFKETAKKIADISGNTVFWAFHRHNLYYTGISNLFQQPEFGEISLIYNMSAVIDRFDEIVDQVFPRVNEGVQVLLGSDNPFGNFCSTVLTKYTFNDNIGMFGILGPMRMDYDKNIALVKFVDNKINK